MEEKKKRRIKYDCDALARLIERVTAHGRGTRTDIVVAMNADSTDAKGKVTLNQLQWWVENRKPVKMERLVSLVNNMDDVSLSDFFVYEDDGEKVEAATREPKKRRGKTADKDDTDMRLELLQEKLEHQQDINRLHEEYGKKMSDLQQLMQRTIDAQGEQIAILKERLGEKRSSYSSIGIAADEEPKYQY